MSHPGGYPMLLDLRGVPAVVVGLGAVGRRKATGLLAAGATVRGVDPRGAAWAVGTALEVRAEAYRADHLLDARLVVAASVPEVNRIVVRDARALGAWVASASEPGSGDWTTPAVWRDGPITLAVATGGASPGLASALRDRAAAAIGPVAAPLAALLSELRAEVLSRIADPLARRAALARAGDPGWLDHLARHGVDATRGAIRRAMGLDEPTGVEGDSPRP